MANATDLVVRAIPSRYKSIRYSRSSHPNHGDTNVQQGHPRSQFCYPVLRDVPEPPYDLLGYLVGAVNGILDIHSYGSY